ncbi:hypothetical protein GGTG_11699 [Gaeumannomyces tritici R3-111a-1]|uniref:Short-chain dehydrogenase/reductase SDR n=1 Tax=Gaeumannomyces tritici (strain R3-111a-1) TaxID=644352 RepID=J3PDX6_GAET3|nr:hypothetical protein GGTG_11699 [Gaeumannomyces tritici R3-111a-1]EJT70676.1 hypothetical protein GGTG_11699 [Gaeumannomyces tritici R3-111a-1]
MPGVLIISGIRGLGESLVKQHGEAAGNSGELTSIPHPDVGHAPLRTLTPTAHRSSRRAASRPRTWTGKASTKTRRCACTRLAPWLPSSWCSTSRRPAAAAAASWAAGPSSCWCRPRPGASRCGTRARGRQPRALYQQDRPNMVGRLLSLDLRAREVVVPIVHPGFMHTEMAKVVGFDKFWDDGGGALMLLAELCLAPTSTSQLGNEANVDIYTAVPLDEAAASLIQWASQPDMARSGKYWAPRGPRGMARPLPLWATACPPRCVCPASILTVRREA